MKFKVSSSLLNERLQVASKFIPSKAQLPSLAYFLFDISGSKLTITASDLDTTLVTSLDIENLEGDGRLLVQSRILNEALKEFNEQMLLFEIDDHNFSVVMKSDFGEYKFMAQNTSEYPEIKGMNMDNVKAFSLSSGRLLDAISLTSFAVANDEIRPIMNGICFHFTEEEGLNVVATDGRCLSKVTLDSRPGIVDGFVFPKIPASLLKNIVSKEVGDVQFQFDENLITCQTGAYTMVSRQIAGTYPKYNSVIPKDYTSSIIVNKNALLSALRRISVCCAQSSRLIKCIFKPNQIVVTGQDLDYANSGVEAVSCSYDGPELSMGYKADILLNILNVLDCEDVEIKIADAVHPAAFIPVQQKEGVTVLTISMPMFVQQ